MVSFSYLLGQLIWDTTARIRTARADTERSDSEDIRSTSNNSRFRTHFENSSDWHWMALKDSLRVAPRNPFEPLTRLNRPEFCFGDRELDGSSHYLSTPSNRREPALSIRLSLGHDHPARYVTRNPQRTHPRRCFLSSRAVAYRKAPLSVWARFQVNDVSIETPSNILS